MSITHDLGVVSELCDTVIVMYGPYRGAGAGRGTVPGSQASIYHWAAKCHTCHHKGQEAIVHHRGMVPNPTERIKGCSFWPRCPHATERCRTVSPPMKQLSEERKVRCQLFEDQAAGRRRM